MISAWKTESFFLIPAARIKNYRGRLILCIHTKKILWQQTFSMDDNARMKNSNSNGKCVAIYPILKRQKIYVIRAKQPQIPVLIVKKPKWHTLSASIPA